MLARSAVRPSLVLLPLSAVVVALVPWAAAADVIEPMLECPAGQVYVGSPGCGGHGGGGGTCGPARCTDDSRCGEGNRCTDVARCFETVELTCVSGDGRNPDSLREYTIMQTQERGECAADGSCPAPARCEHFRECHPVASAGSRVGEPEASAPTTAAPTTAAATPEAPAASYAFCAATPARRSGRLAVSMLLAMLLTSAARSRRARPR